MMTGDAAMFAMFVGAGILACILAVAGVFASPAPEKRWLFTTISSEADAAYNATAQTITVPASRTVMWTDKPFHSTVDLTFGEALVDYRKLIADDVGFPNATFRLGTADPFVAQVIAVVGELETETLTFTLAPLPHAALPEDSVEAALLTATIDSAENTFGWSRNMCKLVQQGEECDTSCRASAFNKDDNATCTDYCNRAKTGGWVQKFKTLADWKNWFGAKWFTGIDGEIGTTAEQWQIACAHVVNYGQ